MAMEVTLRKQNGKLGRADLVDRDTNAVWEVKHGSGNVALAFAQATSYINGTIISENAHGSVHGYGAAGAFHGSFWLNCLGITYVVYYYTPTPGVVIYEIGQNKETLTNEQVDKVYSPKRTKKGEAALAYTAVVATLSAVAITSSLVIGGAFSVAGGGDYRMKQYA